MVVAGRPRVIVERDAAAAGATGARLVAEALGEAVAARGVAHWATTGGSTAPVLYEALLRPENRALVPWRLVHTWWGDDRFVPEGHPLSNVLPLLQILVPGLRHDLPRENLHPIQSSEAIGEGHGPEWAAADYEVKLREEGPELGADGLPMLDLVVLGMGPDGHILSVFPPDSPVWDDPRFVGAVPAPTHIEPHVARVTMHPSLVGAARRVVLIVTGASKAGPLAEASAPGVDVRRVPVAVAAAANATWVLDEAAAAQLPPEVRGS